MGQSADSCNEDVKIQPFGIPKGAPHGRFRRIITPRQLSVKQHCSHSWPSSRTKTPMKPKLRIVAPATEKRTVLPAGSKALATIMPTRQPNATYRTREHLTAAEIEKLIKAASKNRWGHRDATMILVAYRHGLRVSELVDLRWDQIDFDHARLHVRRVKQGTPATHPIPGDEMRALTETAARAGAQIAVRVHVRARIAVLHERLCQACGACW